MPTDTAAKPLPYSWYLLPVVLLVLLGITDTGYLALSHYRNYTDIGYSSFCALSKAINCDTVSQSPWSVLLGLPVAIWGLFGYILYGLLVLTVLKITDKSRHIWSLLLLLAISYSCAAIYFGYISAVKIHSYCILCILSYAISFSLFLSAWIIRRRFDQTPFPHSLARAISYLFHKTFFKIALPVFLIVLVGVTLFLPPYWTYTMPPLSKDVATGITKDFHPWIGAENPILTIEEYSDYQCFQCYKMHFMLRRLIARYPDKIRLIHRHYPMDNTVNEIIVPTPFHVGAGKMAMMAIYAALRGKFWEANDALFALGRDKKPFNTKTLSERIGIPPGELAMATRDTTIRLILQSDIRQGMKLEITGTPSFVIDNHVYAGSIPVEILDRIKR